MEKWTLHVSCALTTLQYTYTTMSNGTVSSYKYIIPFITMCDILCVNLIALDEL